MYMSTFSIFPTLVLQSVGSDLQHQWLRLSLWFLVIAFSFVLEGLYVTYIRRKDGFTKWMNRAAGCWRWSGCPAAIPYRFGSS